MPKALLDQLVPAQLVGELCFELPGLPPSNNHYKGRRVLPGGRVQDYVRGEAERFKRDLGLMTRGRAVVAGADGFALALTVWLAAGALWSPRLKRCISDTYIRRLQVDVIPGAPEGRTRIHLAPLTR